MENNEIVKAAMLGKGTGREGAGGAAKCVCPKCGYEMAHTGGPCNTNKCPECGTTMTGKGAPGEVKTANEIVKAALMNN